MTSAALLAFLLGSWSCTETFEKVMPASMEFRSDRIVVTRVRARGRTGPWQSSRERFALRDGLLTLAPADGAQGVTTTYAVHVDGPHAMTLRARSVRAQGETAFMPFPGSDVSVCTKTR
jgi:hypothetical protein